MDKRTAWALIVASLAFGFVLGWVIAGGRRQLDRPSPGQLSQQMAPGMAQSTPTRNNPAGTTNLPPDHPPVERNWANDPQWQQELQRRLAAVEQNPQDARAWLELARLYALANQNDQAKDAYEKMLALQPQEARMYAEAGFFYMNIGDYARADQLADQALAMDPNQPDSMFLKGTILGMYHKDRAGAIAIYERLLKEHPNYPYADFVRQMLQQMKQRMQSSGT